MVEGWESNERDHCRSRTAECVDGLIDASGTTRCSPGWCQLGDRAPSDVDLCLELGEHGAGVVDPSEMVQARQLGIGTRGGNCLGQKLMRARTLEKEHVTSIGLDTLLVRQQVCRFSARLHPRLGAFLLGSKR